MDINLDLIKRIISSDELCDKVNSSSYQESYKKQICKYVLLLVENIDNAGNITFINRYLRKFVVESNLSDEEKFFDPVLLRTYNLNIKNEEYLKIIDNLNFQEIKEKQLKKYEQIVLNNAIIEKEQFTLMLKFYYYICFNTILPTSHIDYIVTYCFKNNYEFEPELMDYFYQEFAKSFAKKQNLNIEVVIGEEIFMDDPYYDNIKKNITIFKNDITNKIDCNILASIFYQITYLHLARSVNDPNNINYTYEQLHFVKEISLVSILGEEYFNNNYGNISFTSNLKKESYKTVNKYLKKLGIECNVQYSKDNIVLDNNVDEKTDKPISIDILFDQVIDREGVNLLKSLIKNYPVLGCEYKQDKKKSLLTLLTDIYSNRKLLATLNKDLEWYSTKEQDEIVKSKIERLNKKISICSSYINVMNTIIKNGDMTSSDILRSISDLILYDTNKKTLQDDVFSILMVVVPKKIERLCQNRDPLYITNFRKNIITCYLQSMNTVRSEMDLDYFMRLYSTLENINKVFKSKL